MNLVPQNINFVPKNFKFTVELVLRKDKIGVGEQKNYAKNVLIELIEFAVSQSACDVIIISTAIALVVTRAIVRD